MVFASDIDLELYPVSDGKPMADSTLHYRWIVTIKENLEVLFADDPMVVVEADTFWYPVPRLRSQPKEERVEPQAPDVMVIFGAPKRDRGSYKQHEENDIPPQVVFEIYSKSNDIDDWEDKFKFYQRYGVEEYYCFFPEDNLLEVWLRVGQCLKRAHWRDVWVSPRLRVTFDLTGETLQLFDPEGNPFRSFGEERERAERERERAKRERERAKREQERAERERERAERERQQRGQAEARAEQAAAIADRERAEKERMAAKLRELGIDPNEL